MKTIAILLVIFAAQAFSQDLLECFAPIFDNISSDRTDLVEWSQDVRDTAVRLQEQRARCESLPRDDPPTAIQDRMIQACSAAFSLSLAYEMNRLQNDLHAIDPALASDLLRESADCFPSAPEARAYLARVLKNVL